MFGKKKQLDEGAGEAELATMEKELGEGSPVTPIVNPDPDNQKTADELAAEAKAKGEGEELTDAEIEEAAKKAEDEKTPDQKRIESLEKERDGSKKGFYDSRQELKKERAERRKLKLENLKLKVGSFKELTADEQAELKEYDVDAFVNYKLQEKDFTAAGERLKTEEGKIQKETDRDIDDEIHESTLRFVAKMTGTTLTGADVLRENVKSLPKEILDYLSSDKYQAVANHINKRFYERGLVPNSEDMEAAHILLFKDEVLSTARAGAAETLRTNINRAAQNTSPLNAAAGSKDIGKVPDYAKMTPAQVDAMGEKELLAYEKWADEQANVAANE